MAKRVITGNYIPALNKISLDDGRLVGPQTLRGLFQAEEAAGGPYAVTNQNRILVGATNPASQEAAAGSEDAEATELEKAEEKATSTMSSAGYAVLFLCSACLFVSVCNMIFAFVFHFSAGAWSGCLLLTTNSISKALSPGVSSTLSAVYYLFITFGFWTTPMGIITGFLVVYSINQKFKAVRIMALYFALPLLIVGFILGLMEAGASSSCLTSSSQTDKLKSILSIVHIALFAASIIATLSLIFSTEDASEAASELKEAKKAENKTAPPQAPQAAPPQAPPAAPQAQPDPAQPTAPAQPMPLSPPASQLLSPTQQQPAPPQPPPGYPQPPPGYPQPPPGYPQPPPGYPQPQRPQPNFYPSPGQAPMSVFSPQSQMFYPPMPRFRPPPMPYAPFIRNPYMPSPMFYRPYFARPNRNMFF